MPCAIRRKVGKNPEGRGVLDRRRALRSLWCIRLWFKDVPPDGKTVPTIIEELASRSGMTPRYLSDRAKDLLLQPDTTVAYELGFECPQYFARLFKKKTGMTPTEYRTSCN